MDSELTIIGKKYNTDKSTYHGFTDFYNKHLSAYRDEFQNILEIGVFNGSSLKMWKEYFTKSKILAIDIYDKKVFNDDRISTFICDQSDKNTLNDIFQGITFDMIIDDGSHIMSHQQLSFIYLFDKLKSGGFYIIEDLHTSLRPGQYGNDNNKATTLEFLRSLYNKSDFSSSFISIEMFNFFLDRIEKVEIIENPQNDEFGSSITSIIYKK